MAEYIPELHDIGKLVNKEKLRAEGVKLDSRESHTFVNFDFSQLNISKPVSPSWYGQYHFHEDWNDLPKTGDKNKEYAIEVFLTKVADHLAASCTRLKKRGSVPEERGLYKLWKPSFYTEQTLLLGKKWAAVETVQKFKEMFEFIDEIQSPSDFFFSPEYGKHLRLTPEDKSVPNNTVSLYTHTELVGKIYRVLSGVKRVEDNGQIYLEYTRSEGVKSVKEAESQWKYRLLKLYVKFPQKMVRLQDLNVIKLRLKLIEKVIEKNPVNVLFNTDDFLCLLIPLDFKLEDALSPILEKGFHCEGIEIETALERLTTNLDRIVVNMKKDKGNNGQKLEELKGHGTKVVAISLYKREDKLDPPLCDMCQIRTGKESRKEQVSEYLCDACSEIRDMGEPLKALKIWSEEDVEVGWMKISLDSEYLLRVLEKLFNNYVDREKYIRDKNEAKSNFRPLPLEVEFVNDYREMLNEFERLIYKLPDSNGNFMFTKDSFLYPIETYKEFAVFKVAGEEIVPTVIDTFLSALKNFFPECFNDSPVKLSISVSNIKYPFQKHWGFLELDEAVGGESTINVQSPENFVLRLSPEQYLSLKDQFVTGGKPLSHFLHRLADIEVKTKSNMAVMLEILKDRKQYLLKHGLRVQDILNFFKLIRD